VEGKKGEKGADRKSLSLLRKGNRWENLEQGGGVDDLLNNSRRGDEALSDVGVQGL